MPYAPSKVCCMCLIGCSNLLKILFADYFLGERYINNLKLEYERFLVRETSLSNLTLRQKHRGKE